MPSRRERLESLGDWEASRNRTYQKLLRLKALAEEASRKGSFGFYHLFVNEVPAVTASILEPDSYEHRYRIAIWQGSNQEAFWIYVSAIETAIKENDRQLLTLASDYRLHQGDEELRHELQKEITARVAGYQTRHVPRIAHIETEQGRNNLLKPRRKDM